MRDLSGVQARLADTLHEFSAHSLSVRGTVIEFEVPRDHAAQAAQALLRRLRLELALMVCNDLRERANGFQISYLFACPAENWFAQMKVSVPAGDARFDSLAAFCYPASRYEREIHDLFGLTPEGLPGIRPLVRHGFWPEGYYPLRKDAVPPPDFVDDGRPFPFRQIEGEGVY